MKTIKGFEGEEIAVSDFGEWVGKDYIDYKSDYKEHQKIINDSLKQRQELIEYLKEKKKEYTELYNKSCDIIDFDRYESLNILCEEILSKIEKSDN